VLIIFLFSLSVRLGNPDLWHPWLGGEKPMEFAFFNAVLKSVHFPPLHPWFSGHYINYYYYGYVIAAVPTKLLGVMPSIAFNLILPSWFAMTGIGVFSAGYNLIAGFREIAKPNEIAIPKTKLITRIKSWPVFKSGKIIAYLAGLITLISVLFFGNFYESKILWRYLPEASNQSWDGISVFSKVGAFFDGASQVISGQRELPGNKGRWYFDASRPILHDGPDTPIAEFPYFTFLYGDMHPHLLAMPIYGLAFGWIISVLLKPLNREKWKERILSLFIAGVIFGSFRATHTWDYPTFLGLGVLTLTWMIWQSKSDNFIQKIKQIGLYVLTFVGISIILYSPFSHWFHTEYASLEIWKGAKTPLMDYIGVFGLYLFVMVSLMMIELYPEIKAGYRKWMDASGWQIFLPGILLLVFISVPYLLSRTDYKVLAFGFPLLCGIFYLTFLKRGMSILQKIMWVLFGVGFSITFIVEVVVLKGDAGRSNMVFRVYNQAWFILGLAISLALIDIFPKIFRKSLKVKTTWTIILILLVLSVLSYPLIATNMKITDRWPNILNPPHTLNGDEFMLGEQQSSGIKNPAIYSDEDRKIDLSKDYAAIAFMQDFIKGSPVIVEGHTTEYRWGGRYAIHTGLPTVIGWSWHVRQHNSLLDSSIVEKRIDDVISFYNTTDELEAIKFLNKYNVQYIIVSDLERVYYSAEGIAKFELMADKNLIKREFGDGSSNSANIYRIINK
jgi:YYY domain-containing protein